MMIYFKNYFLEKECKKMNKFFIIIKLKMKNKSIKDWIIIIAIKFLMIKFLKKMIFFYKFKCAYILIIMI